MKQASIFTILFCLIPAASLLAQYTVYGAIGDKYNAMLTSNASKGIYIGKPISNELSTSDRTGRYQKFAGYDIYWHPLTGAREIHGPIRDRFIATGAENGFGYPVTDITWCRDRIGKYMHFRSFKNPQHPAASSIYWSPQTNAVEVYGAIGEKYQSIGGAGSNLGYPVAAEYQDGRNRTQRFQHGTITWNATYGARVNGPATY
ncbi:MAG: hypothetical protein ABI760_06720 [Ferruginibacter sp.]